VEKPPRQSARTNARSVASLKLIFSRELSQWGIKELSETGKII
jgi:hypothetical protein